MTSFFDKAYAEIEVGERLRTRGRTITEADIVNWCCHTGDLFQLHTDAEYAATSRYGQRIAPGIMVYAFSAGLVVPPEAPFIVANMGAQDLRFTAPTYIGDTITADVSVKAKRPRPAGGHVDLDWNVFNQKAEILITGSMKIFFAERA
jgi:3-hydroxybutyryl-CoA dehydratase